MESVLYKGCQNELPDHLGVVCRCGWLLLTNENMTNMTCSNPNCIVQNSFLIQNALSILGVSAEIADKTALKFINIFKLKSHMDIFGVDEIDLEEGVPSSINASYVKLIHELERLKEQGISMCDFMNAFNLKDIGDTTSKLVFSDISKPEDFYKMFTESEDESLEEVHLRLCHYISDRIKISHTSNKVSGIARRLLLYKDEILRVSKYFKFKEVHTSTYNIAMTGEITKRLREDGTKFKPRTSFATYLSEKYSVNINVLGLTEKHVGVLIMDEDMTGHLKFTKAMKSRERLGVDAIKVMSSVEFEDLLKSRHGEGK